MSNVPPPITATVHAPKYPRLIQLLEWLRLVTNIAYALAMAALITVLSSTKSSATLSLGITTAVLTLAAATVGYLWSMTTIEAIGVLIDIEANTRQRKV